MGEDAASEWFDIGQNRLFFQTASVMTALASPCDERPTQKAMELGLFRIKETAVTYRTSMVTTSAAPPKVTGKGQRISSTVTARSMMPERLLTLLPGREILGRESRRWRIGGSSGGGPSVYEAR